MANKIDLAEAQFIGFHHASRGYSVRELAEAMGLKRWEWLHIREALPLTDSEKEEVDSIYKRKKAAKNGK